MPPLTALMRAPKERSRKNCSVHLGHHSQLSTLRRLVPIPTTAKESLELFVMINASKYPYFWQVEEVTFPIILLNQSVSLALVVTEPAAFQ